MEDKNAPVVLRNTMRRPLIFRVAGKTVRLSPGQELKVPEAWLGSAELQRFCGTGLVDARLPAKEAAPSGRGKAREEAAADTGRGSDAEEDDAEREPDDDDRESKRSKSGKPKKSKPEN